MLERNHWMRKEKISIPVVHWELTEGQKIWLNILRLQCTLNGIIWTRQFANIHVIYNDVIRRCGRRQFIVSQFIGHGLMVLWKAVLCYLWYAGSAKTSFNREVGGGWAWCKYFQMQLRDIQAAIILLTILFYPSKDSKWSQTNCING